MNFFCFWFMFAATIVFQAKTHGLPINQIPSSVNQLNYLLGDSHTSETTIEAQLDTTTQAQMTKNETATQEQTIFERLPWLDEAFLYVVGVLSRFGIQLVRKFIFRQDIPWSAIF